jgi:hypothetical protein
MLCKILENYGASEGWKKGDIVDISDPKKLIEEGKVEIYVETIRGDTDSKGKKPTRSRKKSAKTNA